MRYSIVYSSNTGNTRQLAEEIEKQLPAGELVYCGAPDAAALQAEVLFVGFWTDKGSCDEKVAELLKQADGKTVLSVRHRRFWPEPSSISIRFWPACGENLPAGRCMAAASCVRAGCLRRYAAVTRPCRPRSRKMPATKCLSKTSTQHWHIRTPMIWKLLQPGLRVAWRKGFRK